MKEMKFMLPLALSMLLFVFTSCEDDDFVPERMIQHALATKYPDATRIEWEKKGAYLVADCDVNNREMDVWFTVAGEWVLSQTELYRSDVPTTVTAGLSATNYANWLIDDIDLLEYPRKAAEYVIEVEQGNTEIDLYFSADGQYLREKDVSRGDDTHWPE